MSQAPAQPGPAAGVELVLVAGSAQTTRAAFAPGVPPAQTTLGSGRLAGWNIQARGVEPVHAELAWDGLRVWVRDAGSANGTYVGVERIDAWRALMAGDRLQLGEATLLVVGDESTAPRAQPDPFDDESTRVQPPVPYDDEESTRVQPSALLVAAALDALPRAPTTAEGPRGAGAPDPFGAESTVITESPRTPPVATPAPSAAIRAMGIPPPRLNRPTPAAQPVPPPRIGGSGHRGERSDEATVAISNEAPGGPVVTPFLHEPTVPSAETVSGAPALSRAAPPTLQRPPTDDFAPSGPQGAAPGELTGMFGALPPPVAPPPPVTDAAVANLRAGYAALPRRTLVLFGVTVLAGLVMIALAVHRRSVEDRAEALRAPPPSRQPAVASVPAVETYRGTPPLAGPPAGPTGTLLAASAAPPAPTPAPVALINHHGGRHHLPPAPVALSPDALAEQTAAAALASGHYADALALYGALATARPEAPVYGQLVQILRRKLEAQAACSAGGTACAPPH